MADISQKVLFEKSRDEEILSVIPDEGAVVYRVLIITTKRVILLNPFN